MGFCGIKFHFEISELIFFSLSICVCLSFNRKPVSNVFWYIFIIILIMLFFNCAAFYFCCSIFNEFLSHFNLKSNSVPVSKKKSKNLIRIIWFEKLKSYQIKCFDQNLHKLLSVNGSQCRKDWKWNRKNKLLTLHFEVETWNLVVN